jgi:hypothetical protein
MTSAQVGVAQRTQPWFKQVQRTWWRSGLGRGCGLGFGRHGLGLSPARRPQTEEPRPNLRYTTWMPASSLPLEAPAPAEGGEGGEGEAAAP